MKIYNTKNPEHMKQLKAMVNSSPWPTLRGIRYSSRNDSMVEVDEMRRAIEGLAMVGLESSVAEFWYDSKSCMCDIKIHDDAPGDIKTMANIIALHVEQFRLLSEDCVHELWATDGKWHRENPIILDDITSAEPSGPIASDYPGDLPF